MTEQQKAKIRGKITEILANEKSVEEKIEEIVTAVEEVVALDK